MKAEKLIINGEEQQLFDWDYSNLENKPTLWTAASKDVGTSAWEVPVLDANWKLDSSIVPSTWVMTSYTVTNKSDLTTLTTAVKWDIWIVTSENKTYILSNDPYSTLSNWTELLFPTGSVSSVNWFTWAVNLTTGYIQESNNNLFVSPTEKATWNNKLWANNVSTVALTGNYGDLNNKPVIDASLNTSSTNAIQNKVVATAVNNINTSITSMQGDIEDLQTASGWAAQDISDIKGDITTIQGNLNTKTFYLSDVGSSATVLAEAQEVYDWINAGNFAILKIATASWQPTYLYRAKTSDYLRFLSSSMTDWWYSNSFTTAMQRGVKIDFSWDSVTWVSYIDNLTWQFLAINWQYQSAFIPTQDAHPATKKYVDDSISNIDTTSIILEWGSTGTFLRAAKQAGTEHLIDMGTDRTYTFQWVGYVLVQSYYGWACEINWVQMFYYSFTPSGTYTVYKPSMLVTMWPWDVVRLWRPWGGWSCTYTVADYY